MKSYKQKILQAARIADLKMRLGIELSPEAERWLTEIRAAIQRHSTETDVTRLTDVQRAFLAGVRHGRRLGRKQTRRDAEDLVDKLKEAHAEVRAELVRRQATGDDNETPLN